VAAAFFDPVKQLSLAEIRDTLVSCEDWLLMKIGNLAKTIKNCKMYPTFAGKKINTHI